ncbi:MAG: recombination mediator RecR [Bacteroidota bacterium]
MTYPTPLLEEAVNEFSRLPGIGRKSALRMVLHLLKQTPEEVNRFGETLMKLRKNITYCKECHNISDKEICSICADTRRDHELVCVVEDIRDVLAIENTSQYKGIYHVLGGIISPMDGMGPSQLNIESLVIKAEEGKIREAIMALSTTMEGDTTVFYIYKKLKPFPITVSTLARGVAVGNDLEYADEITLGRSIVNRVPYENNLAR